MVVLGDWVIGWRTECLKPPVTMWKLLEQAAKTATANASEYVSTVQEKAQTLVATVQDEAATLLHAIGSARTGPVDELLYEEMDDYKVFCDSFQIEKHTDEISTILEEDDEIRRLHEQMVPLQISYEEFWSRYFFRREQEELRRQREEDRKRKKLEEQEARVAAKHALEEFEVDEEDEEEFNAELRSPTAEDERGDVDDDAREKDQEGEATLAQLRELRASRKAATQWKQKAHEYQRQLNLLAEKHETEKQQIKADMETRYQSLCDSYEAKMTEATTQIDEARAVGYNEGIQESEAIVATMQEDRESETNRLKMQIAQLQQVAGSGDGSEALVELNRLNEALALKEQVVAGLEKQKTDLERVVAEKEAALQHALTSAALPSSDETAVAEVKKEMELWKLRAIKMKKAKEQVDAELQQLKDQQQLSSDSATGASASGEYERGLRDGEARTQEQLQTVAKREFDRGAALVSSRYEGQIRELRIQLDRAAAEGEAKAAATYESEVTMLRAEITSLKQQLKLPSDDILANVDSVLDGLTSPTVAGSELLDAQWGGDTEDADDSSTPAAKAPDWGEW